MKKWFALALAAMMMLATLTGCGGTESGGTQQTQETDQGQSSSETDTVVYPEIPAKTGSLTIGISTNALSNIHNRHMFEGLREEAEGRGHTVVTANANGDPTQQANDIENLVQAGCDVIVVQNADNFSLKNAVQEARMAGIRVICEDTGWIDGIDAMFLLNSIAVQADINMILAAEVGFSGRSSQRGIRTTLL